MIDRRSFVLGAAGLGSVSGFAAAQAASGGISAADMPDDFDVVVAGGSCTGVFAALRAAEAGAKVALIELGYQLEAAFDVCLSPSQRDSLPTVRSVVDFLRTCGSPV